MSSPNAPPQVSIVLAAHQAAETIEAAVASLQAQTFRDWELRVVLDRCTDGTAQIVRRLAKEDHRIRPLTAPSGGLVPALNAGLSAARGEFIARMDADDISHPERLAEEVALLKTNPSLGVASCLVAFGGDRRAAAGYARHVDWLNTLRTPEEIALNRFIESPLANPSVLFRRALLDRFGAYRAGPFPEDYEFWLRWLDAGVRMAKAPRVLFTWNDSPGRLTRTDSRYTPEAFYRVKARYLAREIARIRRGRALWIWGAGRVTRRRAEWLLVEGVPLAGYIDVDPRKANAHRLSVPVILPEALPLPDCVFVVSYVGKRGARELIRAHLQKRGYAEGSDFLMAA